MIIDTGFKIKEHLIAERVQTMGKNLLSSRKIVGGTLDLYETCDDHISQYVICTHSRIAEDTWSGFGCFNDALYYYVNVDIDLDKHVLKNLSNVGLNAC